MGSWKFLGLLVGLSITYAYAQDSVNTITALEDPNEAMEGVYTDCILRFSHTCLQKRTVEFIRRMGRAETYPLLGGVLMLVKTKNSPENPPETGRDMVENAIDEFFDTHIIRVQLPWWVGDGARTDTAIDFNVNEVEPIEEGRKKSGGKKGMKKMMMMMCMMMAGKFMMMMPILLGITKIAAIKALIMGLISLAISKIMILKKLKMMGGGGGKGGWSGGSGGGGWSTGGGGGGSGWDRALPAHELAYNSYVPS